MKTYRDILAWARSRPEWQQDALRRLVISDGPSADDVAVLLAMVKTKVGLIADAPQPVLLTEAQLPRQGAAGECVRLVRLGPVKNVGMLAATESVDFAPAGLTVIYGDNASGKSSYAKVLKRMCRARGAQRKLESNVFDRTPSGAPSALIEFSVADANHSAEWLDGGDTVPRALSSVAVFDDHAADAYVDAKQDVPLLPAGLDLLPRLVRTCEQMRTCVETELRALDAPLRGDVLTVAPGTQVDALVQRLSGQTRLDEVERLAALSPEDEQRLDWLRKEVARLVADDPSVRANDARLRSARFRALAQRLRTTELGLSDTALAECQALRTDADAYAEAARLAGTAAFTREPLHGVGTAEWKALWQAAAAYSTAHAYPGTSHPVLDGGARCVLCQQELVADARDRMGRFEEFVRNTASANARDTERSYLLSLGSIREVKTHVHGDDTLIEEVRGSSPDSATRVTAFLVQAEARRAACVQWSKGEGPLLAQPLAASPASALDGLAVRLNERVVELDKQCEPGVLQKLQSELAELEARRSLRDAKERIVARVNALRHADALRACIAELDTTAPTKKNTELTRQAVSDALRSAFATEARALRLNLDFVEVKAAGGTKGVLFHQLELPKARRVAPLGAILSEGERRASALALFLAEASLDVARCALVFDDPVSSFDHLRREAVARRIVQEAAHRQVVVFTHDLPFLLSLARESEEQRVPLHPQTVERRGAHVGHRVAGLPFRGQNITQRIGRLHDEFQRIAAVHRRDGRPGYEPLAQNLYGMLRVAWERAVEEVLFAGVVERQKAQVETNKLKFVEVTPEDIRRVTAGMSKTSRWLMGHDQPPVENTPVPDPEELCDDIEELVDWVGEVRARQQKAKTPIVTPAFGGTAPGTPTAKA